MTNEQWAMKMIPVLIHWAQYSWETPHYYSDLSKAVGHRTNQIGGVLGCVHNIIEELGSKHHRQIPTLNSLVISKSNKLPSNGFSYVLANYEDIPEEEQITVSAKFRQEAHCYDWSWVISALNLEPYNPPISHWILPSNNEMFRIHEYFLKHEVVDWKQYNNFSEGDIVFLYCTAPERKLRYMLRVIRTDVPTADSISDKEYWTNETEFATGQKNNRFVRLKLLGSLNDNDNRLNLDRLKELGIKQFQGASQIKNQQAIDSIVTKFRESNDYDSDLIETTGTYFYEGTKRQVTVNSYERDSKARLQCIKIHGATCAVCGIDFEQMYGELGKGFIHVHHIIPIHTIGKDYQVNPSTDLIPVCPNCHAMLHRGKNADARSISELKHLINIAKEKNSEDIM